MQKETIIKVIEDFVLTSEQNSYQGQYRFYDRPLVGFAAADDPIFTEYKNEGIIGPNFRLPGEWLPGAKTVISFFLPSSEYVKKSNYDDNFMSDAWIHARFQGEEFIFELRRHVIRYLQVNGAQAMAPVLDPGFKIEITTISNWSERHAAYAAGLGTFSLNRGMITEKGIAGRFGSVITDLVFEATERPYSDPVEYCTFCMACVKRCPAKAISESGHDKKTCLEFLIDKTRTDYNKELDHYPYPACGKCQTKVPCENRIPK